MQPSHLRCSPRATSTPSSRCPNKASTQPQRHAQCRPYRSTPLSRSSHAALTPPKRCCHAVPALLQSRPYTAPKPKKRSPLTAARRPQATVRRPHAALAPLHAALTTQHAAAHCSHALRTPRPTTTSRLSSPYISPLRRRNAAATPPPRRVNAAARNPHRWGSGSGGGWRKST